MSPTRHHHLLILRAVMVLMLSLGAGACLIDLQDFEFHETLPGTGGAGQGGSGSCTQPSDCGTDSPCTTYTCNGGSCGTEQSAPPGAWAEFRGSTVEPTGTEDSLNARRRTTCPGF